MANKKQTTSNKSGYIDPTKTGPLSYRELRALNDRLPEESDINAMHPTVPGISMSLGRMGKVNYTAGPTGLGDSAYDPGIASQHEIENLGDIRAASQSGLTQIANGLAKGAILAGTTFLDGTVGLVLGGMNALAGGSFWHNPFSETLQEWNELSEGIFPNYYSQKELDSPWYENIFTANFLGDKFIKNLGFSIGALYSGGVASAALKATRLPVLIGAVAHSTKAPAMVSSAVGATLSAVNEGRIEAINNSKDWQNLKIAELDNAWKEEINNRYADDIRAIQEAYNVAYQEYKATKGTLQATVEGTKVDPAAIRYENRLREINARRDTLNSRMQAEFDNRHSNKKYQSVMGKIAEDRVKMGNLDLLMNLPILMASNIVQFTKFYANGFNTARKAGVKGTFGQYKGKEFSPLKYGYKAIKGSVLEGLEEISQKAVSVSSGNYYSTDVNNWYKNQMDPDAEQETLSLMKAMASGINETVNDSSSWEEFFIGSLTGLLGIPTFRSIRNSNGKLRSPIAIQGGFWNEYKDYTAEIARSQELATQLNRRVQSPEFLNYYRGMIRHNKYQKNMNKAVEDNNSFDFKNAEHAQFVSDITMFDSAGRLGDLRALIESVADTSDENLASIYENTTTTNQDGKKIGPFTDKNGNPMYSTEEGKQEMIDKLNKTKKSMLDTLDNYRKTKNDIDVTTGGSLTDDQLSELTWMSTQVDDWTKRAEDMTPLIRKSITDLANNLENRLTRSISDIAATPETDETLEAIGKAADKLYIGGKRIGVLRSLLKLTDEQLADRLTHPENEKFVEGLIKQISSYGSDLISHLDKQRVIELLKDLPKIGKGIQTYNEKLKEYLSNPEKLAADQAKAQKEVEAKVISEKAATLKSRLSQAKTLGEFKAALDEEEDETIRNSTLSELETEGISMVKDYKETSMYNSEIGKALVQLGESDQVIKDALALWQDQFDHAENLNQAANPASVYVNNEEFFLEDSGNDIDIADTRFQSARYALQRAMSKVNNDIKFRDRFSPAYKEEAKAPSKSKTVSKSTTGDSGTSTVPPVSTPGHVGAKPAETPVGDISTDSVKEENKKAADNSKAERDLNKDNSGQRKYYSPVVPEFHIDASREGDFRPFDIVVSERERGADFSAIYNYLRDNGAFDYVNKGKLKVGDPIMFMIDPAFEESVKDKPWHKAPTIFLVTKDGQVVGSLSENNSVIARYEGLQWVIDKVRKEYQDSSSKESSTDKFVAIPQTRVSKIMIGKIPYGTEEKSLADIPGVIDSGTEPVFGIIKNGILTTNGKIPGNLVIKPVDMAQKEGRLYLLVPNAAGTYSPVAVRVKHFNREEFDINDAVVAGTPMGESIWESIKALASATSQSAVSEARRSLAQDIYMGDVVFNWYNNADGEGFIISRKIRNSDGSYQTYIDSEGKEHVKDEPVANILLVSNKQSITEDNGITYDIEDAIAMNDPNLLAKFQQPRDLADIEKDIVGALFKMNLPIQVSTDSINSEGYNNRVINSNVLTSNVVEANVKGSWFITDYFDNSGNLQRAVNPESVTPAPKPSLVVPIGDTGSVETGTKVTIDGVSYTVDLRSKTYKDKDGVVHTMSNDNYNIFAMAWAQETYGDRTEAAQMADNKVITPKGQVLDRNTGRFLPPAEAQRVKDKLAGKKEEADRASQRAEKIIAEIEENQNKVDKERTDSEYYYIQEDDGEYHEYERVHTRLGSNWIQTESQTGALKAIAIQLSEFVDNPAEFDKYLERLEKKYSNFSLDLSQYKGDVSVKSRQAIVNTIRDKMAGTNSQRALDAGSAVDTVIRHFFTNGTMPVKPDNLSQEAFDALIKRLTEIKAGIEQRGERFLTNNIVLFVKYPDGTRIAGEVDILSVDKNGNFRIYDVKTSKYSFGEFTDRYGHTVNYFVNKSRTQRMSTKDYYTLQLSGYQNLFESQYGVKPVGLAIMPFVLSYTGNQVSSIVPEPGIPIVYNSSVNVPLIPSPKKAGTTSPEKPTVSGQSSLPIFNSSIETMNPENRVLPENAFDEGASVGFYEKDGTIYRGYLKPIGEIGGVPVHITKIRDRGFGREGEFGSTSEYIVVFPNGHSVTVINAASDDAKATEAIIKALSSKPERVKELSDKETKIAPAAPPSAPSVSNKVQELIADESAVDPNDEAFDDDDEDLTKFRKTDTEKRKLWDKEKELAWLEKNLPQLTRQQRVELIEGLIEVAGKGPVAWGKFSKGIITLSEIAAEGTLYHESFHAVFSLMMTSDEREDLLNEARERFGDKADDELEEDLAEAFREYVMSQETMSLGQRILRFFKNLLTKVMFWKNNKNTMDRYFRKINTGGYAVRTEGIQAFHGTGAYRIDQFSNEFLFTGEGNTAYTSGFYFTTNEIESSMYRVRALSARIYNRLGREGLLSAFGSKGLILSEVVDTLNTYMSLKLMGQNLSESQSFLYTQLTQYFKENPKVLDELITRLKEITEGEDRLEALNYRLRELESGEGIIGKFRRLTNSIVDLKKEIRKLQYDLGIKSRGHKVFQSRLFETLDTYRSNSSEEALTITAEESDDIAARIVNSLLGGNKYTVDIREELDLIDLDTTTPDERTQTALNSIKDNIVGYIKETSIAKSTVLRLVQLSHLGSSKKYSSLSDISEDITEESAMNIINSLFEEVRGELVINIIRLLESLQLASRHTLSKDLGKAQAEVTQMLVNEGFQGAKHISRSSKGQHYILYNADDVNIVGANRSPKAAVDRYRIADIYDLEAMLDAEYEDAKRKVRLLNNRRFKTVEEAKRAFDESGIFKGFFYRITSKGAKNATGYKIQILTQAGFDSYKARELSRAEYENSKEESLYFDSLSAEVQTELLNKGWTKEEFDRMSNAERENAVACSAI